MWGIYRKEINTFFSSLVGYMTIGIFLLVMGLILWVLPDFSLLNYPVATMQPMFTIAPFVFMFLLPALAMNTFAEEHQHGTFELLVTKPVSDLSLVFGKFLAVVTLVIICLIPTLIYAYSIHELGSPKGNIDLGQVAGSYIGLLMLGATFAAIGVLGSSLSNNQIVGFIIALALCFFLYWGFYFVSTFPLFAGGIDGKIEMLGIEYHYISVSRGLLDTRDLVYFLSIIALFIVLTLFSLASRNWK